MDVLALNDVVAIDRSIDPREFLQCSGYSFDDGCHVGQSVAFPLFEGILLRLSPVDKVGDVYLEEARHMRSDLHGLHHTVSDDTTDGIHGDDSILGTYGHGWCRYLWTLGGRRRDSTSFGSWSRGRSTLLLLDVAYDVGLTYTTAKARSLKAIQLFLAYLRCLCSLKHYR